MNRMFFFKRFCRVSFAALAMVCLLALSAMAAPVVGPAGLDFYKVPAAVPAGGHGDLIQYRTSASVPAGTTVSCKSWVVMYRSTDALGQPNVVTGTVLLPTNTWTALYSRPIISYAVGTHGLVQGWAPSIQLEAGTDYEASNIAAALNQGYAVVVTDNAGYTTGNIPTYMAGKSQGHAVLDIVTAATQIPSISLSKSAKVGIWGFSQGGQSAAFAGELQPLYAPDMNLQGVAAGGVPAEFFQVARYLDGCNGSGFLLETVVGLWTQYPDGIPLEDLVNSAGITAVAKAENMGVFEALFYFMNTPLSTYVEGNPSLEQLLAIPSVHSTLAEQELGKTKIEVPVFLYHGTADEFIPLNQALQLKDKYCALGVKTTFMVFPGEHITTQFQAASYAIAFLKDRFQGKTFTSTCSTTVARPVPNPNPTNGDFIFSLKKWNLAATIHLKTLGQDVTLPAGSTFTADTNMTKGTLLGTLSIPDFVAPINVVLPMKVGMKITPAQDTVGTASLDKNGILHIHGHAYTNIEILSLSGISVTVYTKTPVDFPIDYDGPVAALGNGTLSFKGTTSFPNMTGPGPVWNALFTSLMSGSGQTFVFTVTPPAPYTW